MVDPQARFEELVAKLRERDHRLTPQRIALLRLLVQVGALDDGGLELAAGEIELATAAGTLVDVGAGMDGHNEQGTVCGGVGKRLHVAHDVGPGNPAGIGAAIRLQFKSGMGPVREMHSGSGYWSQDSAVTVLATPEPGRTAPRCGRP